jgi:hypothetical protein
MCGPEEPTQELFADDRLDQLVTDELPSAIALFEELDDLLDEQLPHVDLELIVPQTVPGAEPSPEPGILDGIFE